MARRKWTASPSRCLAGYRLATTNAEGKLESVVDIAEAPWRVVGLLIRPLLTAFGAGAAALGIGGLGYLIGT